MKKNSYQKPIVRVVPIEIACLLLDASEDAGARRFSSDYSFSDD